MEHICVARELSKYSLEGKWNDYIGVQKEVLRVLREENFFDEGNVTNIESGMHIRITSKGIRETLGNGSRFQNLPKNATISSLPNILKNGHVIHLDVENSHDKNGYKYAYIGNEISLDGEIVGVRISIKQKIDSNHFWIHNIDEYKKSFELLSPS